MNFILTEELVDSIIFAMENQEQLQVLDAAENCLIPFTSLVKVDEENYYKLPEWTSADGFKLRE